MVFNKIINIKYNTKLFHIYSHESISSCYLLVGRTKYGNDYIIDNSVEIFKELLNITTSKEELTWIHAHGPSPHFILYNHQDCSIKNVIGFIKNNLLKNKKSEINKEMTITKLINVQKTNIPGLVFINK